MTKVEMTGFVTAHMEARTVRDLNKLVHWLAKYGVSPDTEIEFDRGKVYIDLTGENSVPADWIECGEHIPPDTAYHIVIDTHFHHEQPAKFDWLTKDRLREAYKQAPDTYEEALEQRYDRYNVEGRPE
jgi:hypothetical protein